MPNIPPKGRFAFRLRTKKYYLGDPENGRPPITPKHLEPVWDEDNECVVTAHSLSDGSFVFKDATINILEKIEQLENTGIFSNARAFIQNRKIYRLFFDNVRKTVRIDPELQFPSNCRYYAVRESNSNFSGTFKYVSGNVNENGIIQSKLIDMELTTGTPSVSIPKVGGLVYDMKAEEPYIVEFYDDERRLVNSLPFDPIAVKVQDIDMTSDNAIVDMIISTNRAYNQEGAVFLYQGEPVSNLEYRVYLKYANGKLRDVTYEQREGGRLQITGLNSLSTESLTGAGTPQKFTARYFMIRDNANLTPGLTEEGAVINDVELSISKDINVHIVEDVYDEVDSITPAAFISGDEIAGTAQIILRIFAHYVSGATRDITSMCILSGFTSAQSAIGGPAQTVVVKIPQGHGSSYKTFNFTLTTVSQKKYCLINGETAIWVLHNNSIESAFNLTIPGVSDNNVYTQNQYKWTNNLGTIEKPVTHFRVRHVIDSKYSYTQELPIDQLNLSNGFGYAISQGKDLVETQPLLIEFLNVVTNELDQPIEIYSTGSKVAYAKLVV